MTWWVLLAVLLGVTLQTRAQQIAEQQRQNTGFIAPQCSPADNCYLYQINNGFPFPLDFVVTISCSNASNNTQTHNAVGESDRFCISPASGSVRDRLCQLSLEYDDPYSGSQRTAATFTDSCGQFREEPDDDDDVPDIKFGSTYQSIFWLVIILLAVIFTLTIGCIEASAEADRIANEMSRAPQDFIETIRERTPPSVVVSSAGPARSTRRRPVSQKPVFRVLG